MKLLKIFLALVVLAILTLNSSFLNPNSVKADDLNQQLQDKQQEIDALQKQLDNTKDQEKTLQSQLSYIDSQTKLTELKIEQTNYQIQKLDSEIDDLSGRIGRLSTSVDALTQVLLQRIVTTYKYSNISTLDLVFSSNGFSDLLEKLKYIEVIQAHDKQVLYQLQAAKTNYNDQKTDKLSRQEQEQKLKQDLDTYQKQLDQDKAAKNTLLRITQNNEAVYQAKLQDALAEQQAIVSILTGGGHEVTDGHVNKGDNVGNFINGASACSSGAHLHFEVHQNDAIQDPSNYLSNTSFDYIDHDGGSDEGGISPHGSWDTWPIIGQIEITQGYGMTPYARLTNAYGPGGHTGIDMWSSASTAVRAVESGELSHGGIACGGGTLYYKKVDHGNGISSYYLHVL